MSDKDLIKDLKAVIEYDPNTGDLWWKAGRGRGTKAGSLNRFGYTYINYKYKGYLAHRVAWAITHGRWPNGEIDHINHERSDNRLVNLREVTASSNQKNASMRRDNTSGITGVYRQTLSNNWRVLIRSKGKQYYLGTFADWFDAVCARKAAEYRLGFHPNHGVPR